MSNKQHAQPKSSHMLRYENRIYLTDEILQAAQCLDSVMNQQQVQDLRQTAETSNHETNTTR